LEKWGGKCRGDPLVPGEEKIQAGERKGQEAKETMPPCPACRRGRHSRVLEG